MWPASGSFSRKAASRKRTFFLFHRCTSYSASCGHVHGIGMSLGPIGKRHRERKFQYRSQKQWRRGMIMMPSIAVANASRSRTAARCGASMVM